MKPNILILLFLFLSSCGQKNVVFKELPEGPIKHHLIVLAKVKDGVKAKGFMGATPAHTKVFCGVGKINNTSVSNDDGSFIIDLPHADQNIDWGEFNFTVNNKNLIQAYKIKSLSTLKDVIKTPFATEKDIDSIDFIDKKAATLSTTGALLSIFDVNEYWQLAKEPKLNILLNQKNNVSLDALMIQKVGNFIAATLFDTHEIAIIDPAKENVLESKRLVNDKNQLYVFEVDPPLTVKNPIDADGSKNKSTIITKTAARNAQSIIALDDTHLLASFANCYQFAEPNQKAVIGPGVVALLSLEDGLLKTKHVIVMPYKNPLFFLKKDKSTIWVSCAGVWEYQGTILTTKGAGLVRLNIPLDFSLLEIKHHIPLNDFAPAEPTLVENKIVIPRSFKNEIAVIDENANAVHDSDKIKPKYDKELNFSFSTHWYGDIVFLGDNSGTLVAYSLSEGFFPFPFIEPIVIDKTLSKKVPLTPLKLYFRHKVEDIDLKTTYPKGYNAWVLSNSYKIYPVDFLAIFGP